MGFYSLSLGGLTDSKILLKPNHSIQKLLLLRRGLKLGERKTLRDTDLLDKLNHSKTILLLVLHICAFASVVLACAFTFLAMALPFSFGALLGIFFYLVALLIVWD